MPLKGGLELRFYSLKIALICRNIKVMLLLSKITSFGKLNRSLNAIISLVINFSRFTEDKPNSPCKFQAIVTSFDKYTS